MMSTSADTGSRVHAAASRLLENWVYGGFLGGLLLLCLLPILPLSKELMATLLCLSAYMIHQYEEHDDDRFRRFLNSTVARGRAGLTQPDIFWVNVPGVWGVIAIAAWLVATKDPGFGLIAAYLLLLNALAHFVGACVFRKYNPGLWTAALIFVPVGIYCLMTIQARGAGPPGMHLLGLGVALLIHAGIAARAMRPAATRGSKAAAGLGTPGV
jgi:hypothetical protein